MNDSEQSGASAGEIEQLVELFLGMGADDKQSQTMAAQLSKRVTQLTTERSMSREDAMEHLLKITLDGWQCKMPEGYEPKEEED